MAAPAPERIAFDRIRAVEWEDGRLKLIDQRLLPGRLQHLYLGTLVDAAEAIRNMVVRGAPAIGITAAYAVVLGARAGYQADPESWQRSLEPDLKLLEQARPTAVNLRWAITRMRALIDHIEGDPVAHLLAEAQRIHAEDIAGNRRMGALGAALIATGGAVLTHCNTGALATGGYGTALGVIRAGVAANRIAGVYASETRPWLQGARLTAWELLQEGIPVTVIADSAAAELMREGRLHWVIVGADRIAANGDVANKIGTLSAALAARHFGVRCMVVAPTSTIDLGSANGREIPIETRAESEVLAFGGQRTAPEGAGGWNPVFDITPAVLVDALVTERGVVKRPTARKLATLMAKPPATAQSA